MASLNLQRNSEVFLSTVDLNGGETGANMKPNNTWKIEVLAGFAVTASSATQDITSLESGLSPDRSQQRFNTAINPVEWNFQTYIRPTGAVTPNATPSLGAGIAADGNAKPVADWFMWQALVSNTRISGSAGNQSVWTTGGKLLSNTSTAVVGAYPSRSNFATATDYHLYFKLDNVVYQVSNASVNQATVDAGIEEIATTTWTGMGTTLRELTGWSRDNAISVFGGSNNNGVLVTANSNAIALTAASAYHPYSTMNVGTGSASATAPNSFIKNRLSTISLTHNLNSTVSTYTFPVTALTFDYTNNMTYLTPEELSALNSPIGQFVGTRAVTGSVNMYLRNGSNESAQFLKNLATDTRTSHAQFATANLLVGGPTGPNITFAMQAVQFEFPQVAIDDVVGLTVNFMAQEPNALRGDGGEVTIFAAKS